MQRTQSISFDMHLHCCLMIPPALGGYYIVCLHYVDAHVPHDYVDDNGANDDDRDGGDDDTDAVRW